jgi:hypothetical protein
MLASLTEDLRKLLNCASRENESNTPDWILAEYMMDALNIYEKATLKRDKYYNVKLRPGVGYTISTLNLRKEDIIICHKIKCLNYDENLTFHCNKGKDGEFAEKCYNNFHRFYNDGSFRPMGHLDEKMV